MILRASRACAHGVLEEYTIDTKKLPNEDRKILHNAIDKIRQLEKEYHPYHMCNMDDHSFMIVELNSLHDQALWCIHYCDLNDDDYTRVCHAVFMTLTGCGKPYSSIPYLV